MTKTTLRFRSGDLQNRLINMAPPWPPLAAGAKAMLLLVFGAMLVGCAGKLATAPISSQGNSPAFEAEAAELAGGAAKLRTATASGKSLVVLSGVGQGVQFTGVPAVSELAIRYATTNAGTISVTVNNEPARKVNVHSSGAFTNSFLHAIIELAIPTNSTLIISRATNDVAVNIDRILVGSGDLGLPPDIWNLPPLPVAAGPYVADWKAMSRIYEVPAWWREAKFGAWSHWTPQSMPEQADWYARGMYIEGNRQYRHHTNHFGHPSEYGYKDICHNWVIDRWKPEELMDLYVEMGAKYFMAMGVHHDNFDCWDSAYQPWNSVRVGPKVDIVGTWEKIARQHGLRFGIGFHHTPARTWGQFMPVRYTSDRNGPKRGVPYDALQTILDGKGKWWEGLDPVDLYGPPHTMARGPRRPENDSLRSPFANQFMWRVDDAITKYRPDVIYFDEHAGDSQVDLGVHMGLGFLGPQLAANYYNKALQWHGGKKEAVLNLKAVGGRYNSFQNSPDLLPHVDRSLVKSSEEVIEPEIMAYSFQTETTIAPWHYQTGQRYLTAKRIVELLMDNVCRNGTMLLNLTQHGRGDLDPEVIRIAKDVGAWLQANGEAVYSSRPFEIYGEDAVRYTRNRGHVYAVLLNWNGGPVTLKSLRNGGVTLGKVSKVELLGSTAALPFEQTEQGLTVTPGGSVAPLAGITNQSLAAACRVLRITHDRGWFNDDDSGARYVGWTRRCNLGTGDFNNDLTISETSGDVWSASFTGSSISVIAPKEVGAGKIEIRIDGQPRATADLSTAGVRLAQQVVAEITGLAPGQHSIAIVNLGGSPVAVDALIVR
jgi:alpha-L-fucosidase